MTDIILTPEYLGHKVWSVVSLVADWYLMEGAFRAAVFRFTESCFAIETSGLAANSGKDDAATQSHLLPSAVRRSPLLKFLLVDFGNLMRRSPSL